MSLSGGQLGAFLATVALIELTPGPNMAYLAVVAGRDGWRAGAITVAGVTLAFVIYLASSVVGLSELLLRWPPAYEALRWAGVAYLLWLALDSWRGAEAPVAAEPLLPHRLFLRGLTANLLNPKATVFYLALLPGFAPHPGSTTFIALGALHIAISVIVHLGIVVASAGLLPRAGRAVASFSKTMPRLFALALAGVAVWLAVDAG